MCFRVLIFLSLTLCSCSAPKKEAPSTPTLQDFYDQGFGQYVGTISPAEISPLEEGGRQYEFDSLDGPMCLRGDIFRAASRPGTNENLLIYLQGGGACWDDFCLAFQTANEGIPEAGILNRSLDVNPFQEWNVGYVPYCDGSLFCGDIDVDEDEDGQIDRYHRGLINLSAAFDAIHNDYPSPERIVLTGMSAGGYGIVLSGALARLLWPGVPIDIIADGGIGLGNPDDTDFITDILNQWGIVDWIAPICADCFSDGHAIGFTEWLLTQDPTFTYKMISSKEDYIISDVFLGIGSEIYSEEVDKVNQRLKDGFPDQFTHFTFGGTKHTTLAIDSTSDLAYGGSMPFGDVVSSDQLDLILGRVDVISIDEVSVADWLNLWLDESPEFTSLTEE